jgi:hypothetical protein
MRPACARIPVAAMAIDLMKSITGRGLRLPLEHVQFRWKLIML